MAHSTSDPLTLEEAKLQLRCAARELDPRAYIARHPLESVLTTAVAGFVVGANPWLAGRISSFFASWLLRPPPSRRRPQGGGERTPRRPGER